MDITPNAQATKQRRDTLDFNKMKNVYASKDTISRVKRELMEWERIFANRVQRARKNRPNDHEAFGKCKAKPH